MRISEQLKFGSMLDGVMVVLMPVSVSLNSLLGLGLLVLLNVCLQAARAALEGAKQSRAKLRQEWALSEAVSHLLPMRLSVLEEYMSGARTI
jgi:hypothetical protein